MINKENDMPEPTGAEREKIDQEWRDYRRTLPDVDTTCPYCGGDHEQGPCFFTQAIDTVNSRIYREIDKRQGEDA